MKANQTKKRFIREATISGIIIASFCALYGGIYFYHSHAQASLEAMQAEQTNVQSQVMASKLEVGDLGKAVAQYQTIPEQNMPTAEGYDNTSSRIRAVRPIIEDLKNRLRFATLDVTFAGLGINENYDNDKFQVVDSTMEVAFTGPSDELVFSFIHEILSRVPGFLDVKKLEMKRSGQIDSGLLRKTANDRSNPVLVEGKITFNWRTLKNDPIKVDVPSIMRDLREPVASVAAPKLAPVEQAPTAPQPGAAQPTSGQPIGQPAPGQPIGQAPAAKTPGASPGSPTAIAPNSVPPSGVPATPTPPAKNAAPTAP